MDASRSVTDGPPARLAVGNAGGSLRSNRERHHMFTLRYRADAPLQPRPHGPTVAKFFSHAEAAAHLVAQPNAEFLEVVER